MCGGLDDFQRVNSSLGHEAGDDLLVTLAGRLQRDLPVSCTAARLSGDEFVVICADHAEVGGPDQLAGLVADLLRTVITVHGRPVDMTASVGLATPVPTGDVRAADLLRFAEAAMLDVKRRQCRGGIAMATDGVVSTATRALELEAELQAAIAADGLVLEYQPVVGPDGRVLSLEALVRWPHPERGIDPARRVPPGRPAQRAAARAGPVGAAHGRRPRPRAGPRPRVARPPSPSTSPGCCRATSTSRPRCATPCAAAACRGTGWCSSWWRPASSRSRRTRWPRWRGSPSRACGSRSTTSAPATPRLARLKELPAQTVKVDRAFVTGIADDPVDFAVARAVVDMAHAMGRNTVAEGVETAEQFHVLRGIGVDAYQGWLFSRPLAPETGARAARDRPPGDARGPRLTESPSVAEGSQLLRVVGGRGLGCRDTAAGEWPSGDPRRPSVIEFRGVTKRYPDGTVAVDELDLTVDAGRITVFVGPSGCGKTTSLRMINRMIEPTEGTILVDGQDIMAGDAAQLRRGIGYVIQQAGLFPHRTILDNIATVPLLLGWNKAKARKRAAELMETVGLAPEMAKRYPTQLSGGQQQRVGVARALAADPPILLMDEPFSAVDPVVRESLQEELLRLQGELGKTIVFVTHDIDEAVKLGDKVAVLRVGGKLAQYDEPGQLLARPVDDFVDNFVGRDRGYRGLGFRSSAALTARRAAHGHARREGGPPRGVGARRRRPRAARRAGSTPSSRSSGPTPWWGREHLVPGGSLYDVGSGSLRSALDAALSSPPGSGWRSTSTARSPGR